VESRDNYHPVEAGQGTTDFVCNAALQMFSWRVLSLNPCAIASGMLSGKPVWFRLCLVRQRDGQAG